VNREAHRLKPDTWSIVARTVGSASTRRAPRAKGLCLIDHLFARSTLTCPVAYMWLNQFGFEKPAYWMLKRAEASVIEPRTGYAAKGASKAAVAC
jgi:hypothetical protein